jgi:transcriptional regulator with XRE-family HTH domain
MREKRTTNCFSRWRGINAFIRHPRTGRGLALRKAEEVFDLCAAHDSAFNPTHPQELGLFLRRSRLRQGLTVRQMSDYTMLSQRQIQAIELGDFSQLPGGLFNRTFVRIYARELGIPETLLAPFYGRRAEQAEAAPVMPPAGAAQADAGEARVKPPRLAEYLLYFFLTKSERINLIGDTEEEFNEVLEKFGRRKANAWFRKQVFDSLRPLVRRSIARLGVVIFLARNAERITDLLHRVAEHLLRGDK